MTGVPGDDLVIRRTPAGWQVVVADDGAGADRSRPPRPAGTARTGGVVPPVDDLTSAMVLADLLAAPRGDRPAERRRRPPHPPHPPYGTAATAAEDELARLRATVRQLEHALAHRVVVEQAIGVLAERHRISPRRAFDRLRQAARSRGLRVRDLAGDVVASTVNPLLPIPAELRRGGPTQMPDRAPGRVTAQLGC